MANQLTSHGAARRSLTLDSPASNSPAFDSLAFNSPAFDSPAFDSPAPGPTVALAALVADPPPGVATRNGTLLLVPGYTGSKEDFAPILDGIAAAGVRAVAIDLPGQHESAGPEDENSYAPKVLGSVLNSLIHRLGESGPVVVLGHSFGGLVARSAVLAGAPATGLVLLCSGPAAFWAGNRFNALTIGRPILRTLGVQALYDGGQRALGLDPLRPDPLARFMRRRFLASSAAGLLGMGHALLNEPDRVDELKQVLVGAGIPVAVLAGAGDDAWPLPVQAEMARRLGTELVLVPGGAHSPAVESPAAMLGILLPLLKAWFEV